MHMQINTCRCTYRSRPLAGHTHTFLINGIHEPIVATSKDLQEEPIPSHRHNRLRQRHIHAAGRLQLAAIAMQQSGLRAVRRNIIACQGNAQSLAGASSSAEQGTHAMHAYCAVAQNIQYPCKNQRSNSLVAPI